MTEIPNLSFNQLSKGKCTLHFAPKPVISQLLAADAKEFVTADLLRSDVDMRIDISHMKNIANNSFDLVVACDVLEHVVDDTAALREIHRILTKDGCAILTIPQKDNLDKTYEDPNVSTAEERTAAYGQWDHMRIYGNDFVQRVEAHGFKVKVVDERNFSNKLVRKHVLVPPKLSAHPLATNHRRIFFIIKSNNCR